METVARREIAERIKTAREWGDLKENSEYHDAKNDQAHLETKILRIREQLLAAEVREVETQTEVVGFGSRVEVEDAKSGKQQTYTLVSQPEAGPAEGKLSIDSPVGKALVGARSATWSKLETPRGTRELKVVAIGGEAPQAVGEHVRRLERREVPAVRRLLPALDVEHALRRPRAARGRSPSGSRGTSAARRIRSPAAATSSSTQSPCLRAQ